ncbi:hypothetical protein BKA62DRAFT_686364 [Auriculariales sp. MPI-PUGE-AT-0066]|nr:hypothetical protein BKA62DRAFT_686364 [Auriculariales sp. MPI-PUGE-AT-0066]
MILVFHASLTFLGGLFDLGLLYVSGDARAVSLPERTFLQQRCTRYMTAGRSKQACTVICATAIFHAVWTDLASDWRESLSSTSASVTYRLGLPGGKQMGVVFSTAGAARALCGKRSSNNSENEGEAHD